MKVITSTIIDILLMLHVESLFFQVAFSDLEQKVGEYHKKSHIYDGEMDAELE